MKQFSIITICLNEADAIRKTCESIVEQTSRDFEWIVVDGASTDGTLGVLEKFRKRIDCLMSEKDEGIYDAMNKGIALASGRYVIFMNGGDAFAAKNVLEKVANAPQKDLIYGDLFFDHVGGKRKSYSDNLENGYLLKNMIAHQAAFYRRELFTKFGVFDTTYRMAGDYEFFVRLMEKGKVSHHHCPTPLAVFNTDGISGDKRYRTTRKQENHRIRKHYFPKYRRSLKAFRQELRDLIG